MIVRILGEGQWEVPEDAVASLNTLDDRVEQAVSQGDQAQLTLALSELLDEVRSVGTPVPDDQLADSDLILPDVDSSLSEVEGLLADSSEGLIPG
ncbi:hypothetical protein SAMN04488544_2599 [Microlunatus sagamiharensis]|uniref:PspA-associated domain-containing protein n=1 Tax=Microlunatus sagamiharensis TaxID=546874 RepID=A0A1H2MS71_9ACTN|nr:hypothetical protein [Microlunatus sagamiharensis]SDU95954.1 hypothetical protein SAMN04488544_2599 [Microlunatus sagamiharensis]